VKPTRRQFLGGLGVAALARPASLSGAPSPLLRPPRLRPGDRVGLVRPASAVFETMPVEVVREGLEALGLEVVLGRHFFDRHGYFAGTDAARAEDLDRFFADPELRMIVAFGGWGAARLLPRLDYAALQASPKVLLGYSDVTALLLAVHARTGLVTFHGPSPRHRFPADYLRRVAMDAEAVVYENPSEVEEDFLVQTRNRIRTLTPGRARGRLLGGNLTVLTAIMGSGYLPDWSGAILFLEDVNEEIYRVDRMLTELSLAGVLSQLGGFVFGQCSECPPAGGYGSLTLEQVLDEHVRPLGIPAWQGAMIGHVDAQFTLPIGVEVEIDAEAGSIRMLEPAVV
jgi:muramoyltetrapeptide carboxypeptidase